MRIKCEIADLEIFVAVAERLNYAAAAEALHLSPSSVSRRIQHLENVLDRRLFDRTTRNVTLTIAGEQLLLKAREIVESMSELQLFLTGEGSRPPPSLTIACVPSIMRRRLPGIVDAFQRMHPHARLRVLDLASNECLEALRNGQADFALGYLGKDDPSFDWVELDVEPLVLAVLKSHPLARRTDVAWSELAGQRLISPWRESGVRVIVDQALAKAGLALRWFHEVRHVTTALILVQAGMGVTVVPKSLFEDCVDPNVVPVDLVNPGVTRSIGIMKPAGRALRPIAQSIWDVIGLNAEPALRSSAA